MLRLVTLHAPVRTRVARWSETAQRGACRNAMVASTALTQARRERTEVEEYVVGTLARRAGGTPLLTDSLPTPPAPLAAPVPAPALEARPGA